MMNEEKVINWLRRHNEFKSLRLIQDEPGFMRFEAEVHGYAGKHTCTVTKDKSGALQAHTKPAGN